MPVKAHLKASGLNYGILGLVPFFDNVDDPANWNPLVRVGFVTCSYMEESLAL